MDPAGKLRCKDQMKYYLNIKKIRLMCHSARETVWGQIFYNITCRENEWDTKCKTKRNQGGWMAVGVQATYLTFLVKHWDNFSFSFSLYFNFSSNMRNLFVY